MPLIGDILIVNLYLAVDASAGRGRFSIEYL
jgi:hypothetical protein